MRVAISTTVVVTWLLAAGSAGAATATVKGSAYDKRYAQSGRETQSEAVGGVLDEGHGSPGYAQQRQTSLAEADVDARTLRAAATHVILADDIRAYNRLNPAQASAELQSNIRFYTPGLEAGTPFRVNFNPVVIDGLLGLRGPESADWEGWVQMGYTFQIGGYYRQTNGFISSNDPVEDRLTRYSNYEFDLDTSDWAFTAGQTYKITTRFDVQAFLAPSRGGYLRNANVVASSSFGNTVYWGGIASLTLMDGTPIDDWSIDTSDGIDWASASPRDVGGVPEPATWALMIGGFGFAGARLRQRRLADLFDRTVSPPSTAARGGRARCL